MECNYLIEVIADEENLGKVQFLSCFDTVDQVVEDFAHDRDVQEDLGIQLQDYHLKRVDKFSPKFGDYVRIRNDSVLSDGDMFRTIFFSGSGKSHVLIDISNKSEPPSTSASPSIKPETPKTTKKPTPNSGPRTITVHGDLKTGSVPSRSVSKDVHVKVPPTSGSKVCSEKLALPTTKPTTSVSKSQLQAAFRTSRSPVVQNAIIEWNKFNKVVRTLTRSTEWNGSGGFHQCVGTTTEEAFLNEKLRDELSGRKELTDLYKNIRIPGLGTVTFDKARALDQIRSVLAEMKKKKHQLKGVGMDAKESSQRDSENDQDLVGEDLKICGERTKPIYSENLQSKTEPCAQEACEPPSKHRKIDCDKESNSDHDTPPAVSTADSDEEETQSTLGAYELRIREKRAQNLKMMHSLDLAKDKTLLDEDAEVVTKAWFPVSLADSITISMLQKEAKSLGLSKIKRGSSKREAFIFFGCQLKEKGLVTLTKEGGLTRGDVKRV